MKINHKNYSFNELRSRALKILLMRVLFVLPLLFGLAMPYSANANPPTQASTTETSKANTHTTAPSTPAASSPTPALPTPKEPQPKPLPGSSDLFKTVTGLVFTLGLLFGLLWLLKKTGMGMQPRGRGFYRIVASSSLGSRERICLLEIGDTWLVVGMTAHSMNTLHTLPAGSIELGGTSPVAAEQFAKLLGHLKPKAKAEPPKEPPPKEPTS